MSTGVFGGLRDWITGNLSSMERVATAIGPAVVLLVYVLGGLVAYLVRGRLRGRFHDEEMDHRGLGGLTTAGARHFFAWLMRPLWRGLAAVQIPPNAITTLSMGLAIGAGVALAAGRFALGGWLYLAAGALDFLDGRVARVTNSASSGGAVLDSVVDRYSESAVLVGLAWYYRESWVLMPCLLALTGSLFVPYVRARGEALGATMKDVGFMQRPERILLLGITVALSPIVEVVLEPQNPHPPHWLAVIGLIIVAATSHTTAVQRLAFLVRSLSGRSKTASHSFTRYGLVAVAATAVDFVTMRGLVEHLGVAPPWATALGCAAGALVAFLLSRSWAFRAHGSRYGSMSRQALRFGFVSGSSALLNAGGVAVLLLLPSVGYALAWALTRALVFATWNYPLMRDHVFATPPTVTSARVAFDGDRPVDAVPVPVSVRLSSGERHGVGRL